MLKLQFRDRRQESVWMVDESFTIGKNKTSSLVIDEPSISEQHAEIIREGQRLKIRDLGAEHGIFLNGVRVIGEQQIAPGNIIKLGTVELEIVDPQQTKASTPAPEHEWRLIATASWMNGQSFDIKGPMTLGRDPTCDIAIPVEHLSRKHAELSIQGGKLVVKDLDSSNGTYVNGQRVNKIELKPGDKLKFDVITFTIEGPEIEEADHDPNKTIVRSAVDFQKEIQAEIQKKKAEQQANAASNKPAVKPAAPKATSPKPTPTPEKDKDSWITEPEQKQPSSGMVPIIIGIVILGGIAGAAAYFLM